MPSSPRQPSPELLVRDAAAWRRWLHGNHRTSDSVRLVLAKGGSARSTTLTHAAALEEALCYGWIDGQASSRDDATWIVRFTPRRSRSAWSKRNTEIVERLIRLGRMRAAGHAEIERAKADGRWDNAYAGTATIEVPPDFARALKANPAAKAMFDRLSRSNRFAVLYRIQQAKRPQTRARRIENFVSMLARGETLYPQRSGGSSTRAESSSTDR